MINTLVLKAFFFTGGCDGVEQEAHRHWQPVKKVWTHTETPGDIQQEATWLCTGKHKAHFLT